MSTSKSKKRAIKLCATCVEAKFGTRVPMRGILITADDFVERCDDCPIYESDYEAALALAAEVEARNPQATGVLKFFVNVDLAGEPPILG